ncbi:MAG: sigma-70 family RNA polymerase sigma factor [Candidatus Poribacteria bacterium]|nr:sigma-70 family RNA polymerase sigma factor [Candidatus Poribacteria bacterium]
MKENDVALIQRTLDGDEGAFTTLVKKYQKWVHTLVWRKIGDFHTAEEITQDIFLKVYKKLSTLKPPDHFPGWLYVITTRHCISWLRKKQVSTTSLDAMPTTELEELCYARYTAARDEEASIDHQRELVKRLLQKLPESERTVVTLFYLAEMTSEEVSAFLGVSPNTIRSRLRRARKRLKEQEHLLHTFSGIFRLPPTLTENIMREIARIKPASPSVSKPWMPWGFSFASTFLVILMVGMGPRALSRFQQPYNLDAASEMTIELVEAPVVRALEHKSDRLTQFGRADIPGKNGRAGFQMESFLIAAAQTDEVDVSIAEPQWVQTRGPGGVSAAELFLASDQTLYTITKTGLYKLAEKTDAWTFVSSAGPNREFAGVMAEHGDTLYLLTTDEVLTSIDDGRTWEVLSDRPKGRAVALVITDAPQERSAQSVDITMYLILRTEVFRSQDAGKQWESIGHVLRSDVVPEAGDPNFRIYDALAVNNILFVGASAGLFRFTDNWKKLTVPTQSKQGVKSLAVAEDKLYIGTIIGPRGMPGWTPHASVLFSTDLGDSWTDITPPSHQHPVKLIAAVEVVPVGGTLMVVGTGGALLSYDHGKTWVDPGRDRHTSGTSGASPVVALDENNFYKTDYHPSEIIRSTDGGFTWHPFMSGLVSSHVQSLVTVENVLYALTPTGMLKSTDGGESWESIGLSPDENASLEGAKAKVATANGVLYASNSELTDVTLFQLSDAGDLFLPVEGVPDFEENTLHTELEKKVIKMGENDADLDKAQELWSAGGDRIVEEWRTNGTFTLADDTVFMEYRHKLYRWRRGETAWHYTGLEDSGFLTLPDESAKGLTLGVSGDVVYAGKREGELFQSLDNGDTWNDITESLPFPFVYFKEIVFAGSTVYILTDAGVMRSLNGEVWHALTDTNGKMLLMDRIVADGLTLYGICDSGVYQVDNQTGTWKHIAPVPPHTVTSLAVDGDTFYIGTKHNGVFRLQRANQ